MRPGIAITLLPEFDEFNGISFRASKTELRYSQSGAATASSAGVQAQNSASSEREEGFAQREAKTGVVEFEMLLAEPNPFYRAVEGRDWEWWKLGWLTVHRLIAVVQRSDSLTWIVNILTNIIYK